MNMTRQVVREADTESGGNVLFWLGTRGRTGAGETCSSAAPPIPRGVVARIHPGARKRVWFIWSGGLNSFWFARRYGVVRWVGGGDRWPEPGRDGLHSVDTRRLVRSVTNHRLDPGQTLRLCYHTLLVLAHFLSSNPCSANPHSGHSLGSCTLPNSKLPGPKAYFVHTLLAPVLSN